MVIGELVVFESIFHVVDIVAENVIADLKSWLKIHKQTQNNINCIKMHLKVLPDYTNAIRFYPITHCQHFKNSRNTNEVVARKFRWEISRLLRWYGQGANSQDMIFEKINPQILHNIAYKSASSHDDMSLWVVDCS